MTTDETIDLLNRLIHTAKDGELGYRAAEQSVKNTQWQTALAGYAKQRGEFVHELQAEIERLGGTPADTGTVAGTLYRGWIGLKAAVSGGDETAILASCETGEDSAAASYEAAAATGISGQTRKLVESQWQKIKETHQRLRHLLAQD